MAVPISTYIYSKVTAGFLVTRFRRFAGAKLSSSWDAVVTRLNCLYMYLYVRRYCLCFGGADAAYPTKPTRNVCYHYKPTRLQPAPVVKLIACLVLSVALLCVCMITTAQKITVVVFLMLLNGRDCNDDGVSSEANLLCTQFECVQI